jgi:lysophospholipase L1-like esterase
MHVNRGKIALFPALLFSLTVLLTAAFAPPARSQQTNYLALGDSYAFGYTTRFGTTPGFGDQGYVAPFADFLATRYGVRPTVTNLAVPGETSATFFSGPTSPINGELYNFNYAPTFNVSQSSRLADYITQQQALGRPITPITTQLGGNDILDVLATPGFVGLPALQQQALLGAAFATIQANYTSLLTTLRTAAPQADLFLLGYPDPFAGLGAANPTGGLSTVLTLQSNALYANLASAFNARFVETYTAFVGNELNYTFIASEDPPGSGNPNYHPNATGYGVIARQLITAAADVPEPGSLLLLACGALPLTRVLARRRRPGNGAG